MMRVDLPPRDEVQLRLREPSWLERNSVYILMYTITAIVVLTLYINKVLERRIRTEGPVEQ